MQFAEPITSEEQLRAVTGWPAPRALKKEITTLDVHCRAIIAKSPFVLISSCDAEGRLDISPKGDPPGFVQLLDESTLAIPDRPGNRRADTYRNVLQNPRVGLLFLVPGRNETLRVNGQCSDRARCRVTGAHGGQGECAATCARRIDRGGVCALWQMHAALRPVRSRSAARRDRPALARALPRRSCRACAAVGVGGSLGAGR